MARFAQVFAPRDRVYFELFEEAGQNMLPRLDAALRPAHRLPGQQAAGRRDPRPRARGRPDHPRHHRSAQPHVRDPDRPRGHPRAGLGARRHRRLHRGGRRLPRPVQDRGADGPGDLAGPRAQEASSQIAEAIPNLRGFRDISRYTVEVNRLENEGDRITREAVASLFDGGIDPMVVIRWKDIFERLEAAIDAAERAANIIEGIVIKNS